MENGVAGSHLFPVPTRGVGDLKRCNLNGNLAPGCGLYNADSVKGRGGEKLFPGDVVTCLGLDGEQNEHAVCRIPELFFDEDINRMRLTLRPFRKRNDICNLDACGTHHRHLLCIWEDVSEELRITVTPEQLGDLCIVFTREEANDEARVRSPPRRVTGLMFVGGGFCEKSPGSPEEEHTGFSLRHIIRGAQGEHPANISLI